MLHVPLVGGNEKAAPRYRAASSSSNALRNLRPIIAAMADPFFELDTGEAAAVLSAFDTARAAGHPFDTTHPTIGTVDGGRVLFTSPGRPRTIASTSTTARKETQHAQ